MPIMTDTGASRQTRGYIIGLTRKLQELLGIDSDVVARIERTAKVGDLSEADAVVLIATLKAHVDNAEADR